MYKLYTDKDENFECKISVEGTNLSKASARLVLESNEYNLMFTGKIDSTGKCIIPIPKLKLLSENLKGKLKLEVIVDNDTYFVPYTDDFLISTNRKVTVEVLKPESKTKKVIVEMASTSTREKLIDSIYNKLKAANITILNISKSDKARTIISEHISRSKFSLVELESIKANLFNRLRLDLKKK